MKKSKILVVGLIGLLMAGGLVLAGCEPGCSNDGECEFRRGVLSGPSAGPGVDNVCSDSDCNVYKAKWSSSTGSSSDCNCS
jgi:hypothetical protein